MSKNQFKTTLEKPLLTLLFIALIAAHIGMVWLLPYFPTQDGPSHTYNLSILKDLRSGGKIWGGIYYQQLSLQPNLGFNIVAYPLLFFFEPLVVEKLFISVYILLLTTSVPALLKMIEKPVFPTAFLVFPATLSYSLAMGFYSYVIALPLVLLAGGVCWRIRAASLMRQCLIITTCAMIIYCFHLIACVFFVILIAIQQLDSVRESIGRKLWQAALLLLPMGIMLLGYFICSSKRPQYIPTQLSVRMPTVIADLVLFGSVYFSTLQIINGVMLFLAFYMMIRFKEKLNQSDASMVFGFFSAVLVIIAVCAPSSFGGGSYFNERLPQMILLGLIPVVAGRKSPWDSNQWGTYLLTALSIICFAVNVTVWCEKSTLVNNYTSLLNTNIEDKSIIMSYRKCGEGQNRVDVLAHAVSHYALRHNLINAGNYEAGLVYFPIRFLQGIVDRLPLADTVNYAPQLTDFARFTDIRYVISEKRGGIEDLSQYY